LIYVNKFAAANVLTICFHTWVYVALQISLKKTL
jgi:hypothetical protein